MYHILLIILAMFASYSVYLFFSIESIMGMSDENAFFELGTAGCFFIGAFLLLRIFFRTRNLFYLMLALALFFGGGEEMSWGQHLFGFGTPGDVNKVNVQGEFNIHNLEIFNTGNFDGTKKEGWRRLLEINFLFRLFCLFYGIVLPLAVNHIGFVRSITDKLRLPVPPVTIGIFFAINYITYYILLRSLPGGHEQLYYNASSEIFEFIASVVLMVICYYFLQTKRLTGKKTTA